jgi:hypothetical protein
MSKALNKLHKLETESYKNWGTSVRMLQMRRNALTLADLSDVPEASAAFEMSIVAVDAAFGRWQSLRDAISEIEAENFQHHGNGEARRRQPKTQSAPPAAGDSGKEP